MDNLSKNQVAYGAAAAAAVAIAGYLMYSTKSGDKNAEQQAERLVPRIKAFKDEGTEAMRTLYKTDAAKRAAVISDVSYQIAYALHRGGQTFLGHVTIKFNMSEFEDTFLDYKGETVHWMRVNGKLIEDYNPFANDKILIKKNPLMKGVNTVEIQFESRYVRDCEGIHYYKDNADGEEYLYSQFEAASAHKAFPCFDQPNLKAPYSFLAVVPKGWIVLSTEPQCAPTSHQGSEAFNNSLAKFGVDQKEFTSGFSGEAVSAFEFGVSKKISVYLYSCIAGPYATIESEQAEVKSYRFPLKLYCRKSISKYVEKAKEEYFTVTKSGIDFYERLFSTKYPFAKLDQVFIPDYNMGAMENVGCVIYRDQYVERDELFSWTRKQAIMNVFLHEISHMWFGNLVTMDWWDDLWLNESFANYVSYICLHEAPGLEKYTGAWSIFLDESFWGLGEDQAKTTHPICMDCIHTESAQDIFDGISYGKGAAWLNQTFFLYGRKMFQIGIEQYFKEYAFKNTKLEDFIRHMNDAAKQVKAEGDFIAWTDSWLKTAGCNYIWHDIVEENGKIKKFTVNQDVHENGEGNRLRRQKYQVAFYDKDMKVISTHNITTKDDKKSFDEPSLVGLDAPFAYHINYMNYGFGKFIIDPKSMKAFEGNLVKIESSMSRKQLYNIMQDMLQIDHTKLGKAEAILSGAQVLEICKSQMMKETAPDVISDTMRWLIPTIIKKYLPHELYEKNQGEIFEMILDGILTAGTLKNDKATLHLTMDALFSSARSEKHYKLLQEMFDCGFIINTKKEKLEYCELSLKHKYEIVKRIYSSAEIDIAHKQKIMAVMEEDKTNADWLDNCKSYCEAALPENKEKMWNLYFSDSEELKKWELHKFQNSHVGYNQPQQRQFTKKFENEFFDKILTVQDKYGRSVVESYFFTLRPMMEVSDELIQKYRDLLKKVEETNKDNTFMINMLKETLGDLEERKKCIAASKAYLQKAGKL